MDRQEGSPALLLAAENGHAEAVRLLLESNADVNGLDKVSRAPPPL